MLYACIHAATTLKGQPNPCEKGFELIDTHRHYQSDRRHHSKYYRNGIPEKNTEKPDHGRRLPITAVTLTEDQQPESVY